MMFVYRNPYKVSLHNPGSCISHSNDLVSWTIGDYVHDKLDDSFYIYIIIINIGISKVFSIEFQHHKYSTTWAAISIIQY